LTADGVTRKPNRALLPNPSTPCGCTCSGAGSAWPLRSGSWRAAANRYETRFLELCERFRTDHRLVSPKLDLYLRGLWCQASGNVVWSLNCPRSYPEFRYDPNADLEDVYA
jgi:hypothetical protein